MSQVHVRLPDGSKRSYSPEATFAEVAQSIGAGLAKAALAVKANGKLLDLSQPVGVDTDLEILTSKSADGLEVIRHSTAHVLAMAVQKLWPGTQVTIGPVIDNGFYYDFKFPDDIKINDRDLERIEAEMKAIVKADLKIAREVVSRNEAVRRFDELGEKFKVELVSAIPESEQVSIYGMGNWFDLCRGPHVPTTAKVGAFKLMTVAGAYWRGDERNA